MVKHHQPRVNNFHNLLPELSIHTTKLQAGTSTCTLTKAEVQLDLIVAKLMLLTVDGSFRTPGSTHQLIW